MDGDSGTGKTFLCTILKNTGIEGFDLVSINYSNYGLLSKLSIKTLNDDSLVILDNADLYLTKDLIGQIFVSKAIFIVFTRNYLYFNRGNSCVCKVIYEDKRLQMRGDCDEDCI